MDAVFKKFNVCEDIAEMIAKKVHLGNQKEINDHISIMIAWNPRYNYWKIYNKKLSVNEMMMNGGRKKFSINGGDDEEKDYILKTLYNSLEIKSSRKKFMHNSKLPDDIYVKYLYSDKKIFDFTRYTRISNFWIHFLIDPILPISISRNLIDNFKDCELQIAKQSKDVLTNWLKKDLSIKKILKKDLVNYMNENGDTRKFSNYKIVDLWKKVMSLDVNEEKKEKKWWQFGS